MFVGEGPTEKIRRRRSDREDPTKKVQRRRFDEKVTLSLEEELSSPTLKCDKVPLILEGQFQDPSLVENNELAIEEEPVLKTMQVEEQHPRIKIENVLVGVDQFNFPIDSLTFGKEEDRQVSSIEKPSFATSQVCIDAEHGEMTFLIGKEKMKFDLHQSIPLTDEERIMCMKIKSSLLPIEEHAPMFLQEDTLQGLEFMANSLSTKELASELTSHNTEMEKLILASNEMMRE